MVSMDELRARAATRASSTFAGFDARNRQHYVLAWGGAAAVLAILASSRKTRGLAVALAFAIAFYTATVVSGWRRA